MSNSLAGRLDRTSLSKPEKEASYPSRRSSPSSPLC
jgi:hypothetical protein